MSRIHDFYGGIHPPERKALSLQAPLRRMPLVSRLVLPLQQHMGRPAEPVVNPGTQVFKGQPLAYARGRISAAVHAPTSGRILAIEDHPVPHPSGMSAPCLILEADGEEDWQRLEPLTDPRPSRRALAQRMREAGLAGLGGAGFPTEVKLHLADDHIVNTLIVNAVECEPYITADDILMRTRAEEILGGIDLAADLLEPTHILVGIEDNKPEAAKALVAAARQARWEVEVVVVPSKYPSGGERQLIQVLAGVEVPQGHIPADIGIVVQNVGTLAALHRAVRLGEPLVSRIVTLTGEALAHPGNYEVPLGTPMTDLLEYAGLDYPQLDRLIMGGPMMGYAVLDLSAPVIKTSNCLIAATATELPPPPPARNCIRCGACEQVCPARLLPQQLHWFARSGEHDKAQDFHLLDCIECGACAYVCPSHIPLVQYFRHAKGEIRREQAEQRKAERARQRYEARNARMEREKAEKAARRRERAEAAARQQAQRRAEADKPGAASSDPSTALKSAKTQAALARTQLNKTRKALADAEARELDNAPRLRAAVQQLEAKSRTAEENLKAAEAAAREATS